MSQVIKITIWNSTTSPEADNRARLEVPNDGKPHKTVDVVKSNNSKYPGKVVGNTILVKDAQGAKLTLTPTFGHAIQVSEGKEQRFGGGDKPLDDAENYDVTDWTITAKAS